MNLDLAPLAYHEQMKLAEAMAFPGMSQKWWNRTVTAAAVRAIDGTQVIRPSHVTHVRDLMRRLGPEWREVEKFVRAYKAPGERPPVETEALKPAEEWELEFLSGDFYDIPAWSGIAYLACTVRKFDGTELSFPANLKELRKRVTLLGFHGIAAAAEARIEAIRTAAEDEDETDDE